MTKTSTGSAIAVRIIGVLGAVVGAAAVASGVANWKAVNPVRDIRIFIAIGAYLIGASAATMALRKIGALMLVLPLAGLGIAAVVGAAAQGPAVALLLNLGLTAPLMCGPAYVVWRNRGVLR